MNTIQAKIPAYGMPVLEGPINKPEKVNMMPPMGDMPPMPGAPCRCRTRKARPRFPRRRTSQGAPVPRMESIDVLDGKLYVAEQPYAEISGNITGETMSNASYHTDEVCLNGLYIGGDSVYSIKDSAFDMVGYGIDDFAGNGSAIMVNDTAKCEMDNVHVTTHGVIRPCTVVTGNGT